MPPSMLYCHSYDARPRGAFAMTWTAPATSPYRTSNACFWRIEDFFTASVVLVMMVSAWSGVASATCWIRALSACRAPTKTTFAALRTAMVPFARVCAAVSAAPYFARASPNAVMTGSGRGKCGLFASAACTDSPNRIWSWTCVGRLRTARTL